MNYSAFVASDCVWRVHLLPWLKLLGVFAKDVSCAVFVKSGRSVAAGVRLDRAMLVLNVFLLQRLYV